MIDVRRATVEDEAADGVLRALGSTGEWMRALVPDGDVALLVVAAPRERVDELRDMLFGQAEDRAPDKVMVLANACHGRRSVKLWLTEQARQQYRVEPKANGQPDMVATPLRYEFTTSVGDVDRGEVELYNRDPRFTQRLPVEFIERVEVTGRRG